MCNRMISVLGGVKGDCVLTPNKNGNFFKLSWLSNELKLSSDIISPFLQRVNYSNVKRILFQPRQNIRHSLLIKRLQKPVQLGEENHVLGMKIIV